MSTETAAAVKQLLMAETFGVLSTLQLTRKPGWPMASLAPYALTAQGEPILAMSALAQHTRNLAADPRASGSRTRGRQRTLTATREALCSTETG